MSKLTTEMKAEIRQLVTEQVEEILQTKRETTVADLYFEEPPEQEKLPHSNKYAVPSQKISAMVPGDLATRFHQERKRAGKSTSQMMAWCLHNLFRIMDMRAEKEKASQE